MTEYVRASISNGIPSEQALIRRWWHEEQAAGGRMVWEYYLRGKYADAIWFYTDSATDGEEDGQRAPERFPVAGADVVLCEAKGDLTPEVIGQALVYTVFAKAAGANVRETVVFTETGSEAMQDAARQLGLRVVVKPL